MLGVEVGVAFIKCTNKTKCAKLTAPINDQRAFKTDVYPENLHNAYDLMEIHSLLQNSRHINNTRREKG